LKPSAAHQQRRSPASVFLTRATSTVRPPATTHSAFAVASPGAHELNHLFDREAMRHQDCLGTAIPAKI
jgi:hypothetical protein